MPTKRAVAVGIKIGRGALASELGGGHDFETTVEWHAAPAGGGDYDTLCGVDANDPTMGHHGIVEAKSGQKINCRQCKEIWNHVMSLKLRVSNFE